MLFLIASTRASTPLSTSGGSSSEGTTQVKSREGAVVTVPLWENLGALEEGEALPSVPLGEEELACAARVWSGEPVVCSLEMLVKLAWVAEFFCCGVLIDAIARGVEV